jgi:hypothetical protein
MSVCISARARIHSLAAAAAAAAAVVVVVLAIAHDDLIEKKNKDSSVR